MSLPMRQESLLLPRPLLPFPHSSLQPSSPLPSVLFRLFFSSRSPTFSPLPRVRFSCSRLVEGWQPEARVSWDGWSGRGRNGEV